MKRFHSLTKQKGIGMPEVMVAMLLLGIAVVGFSALQVRAVSATNESGDRTQAMAIALDLSERMRLNPGGRLTYKATWNPTGTSTTLCEGAVCNAAQMASYDIRQVTDLAAATLPNGRLALSTCPGRANSCIYVAWNNTSPTIGDSVPNCSKLDGTYVSAAPPDSTDCVISEVY